MQCQAHPHFSSWPSPRELGLEARLVGAEAVRGRQGDALLGQQQVVHEQDREAGRELFPPQQQLRVLDDLLKHGAPLAGLEGEGVDLCRRRFEVLVPEYPGLEAAAMGVGGRQYAHRFMVEGHLGVEVSWSRS